MRFIPTRVHGILDYLVSIVLIAAPWLLGFNRGGAETWTPVTIGVIGIIYSLLTNYEWGVLRVIPINVHLILDIVAGLFLAASPWLFHYADYVYLPHVIVGIFEVLAGLMTVQTVSGTRVTSGGETGRVIPH